MKTFEEFWPFYLSEHARPMTRTLHFIGSTAAGALAITAAVRRDPKWLLGALVAGYGFAWVGHFGVEKNRPATFKHPLWSLAADWKMWGLMLTGRLDAELARKALPPR
jgi:hypothetical protein